MQKNVIVEEGEQQQDSEQRNARSQGEDETRAEKKCEMLNGKALLGKKECH